MNINLNLYKYFYEVAKRNSFTKAAADLLISQPSLSYSIKVLENQLGYRLFNRIKGKIILTNKGKRLYEKLKDVFSIISDITDENDSNVSILLGIRPLLALYALPPFINQLVRLFPDININYKMAGNSDLINGLQNDKFDFIIDEYNYENNDIVSVAVKEKDFKSGFVIANKYYKDILIDKDYIKNNRIFISDKNKYSIDFINKYNIKNYDVVSGTPVLVEELLHNNKVAFSNLFVLKENIDNGNIKVLRTNLDLPTTTIYISYKKNKLDKKIETVIDFFKNNKIEEIKLLNIQNEDK